MPSKALIVGLGNPGREYVDTRHNVGFMLVDLVAQKLRTSAWHKKWNSLWAEGRWKQQEIYLLKPQTYMNLSGQGVKPFVEHLQVPLERVLIVYDDLDLPLGRLRFRARGSSGGHKGMASILHELDTNQVGRLRIGIGPLPEGVSCTEFVLGEFTSKEKEILQELFAIALDGLWAWLYEPIEKVMANYNHKKVVLENQDKE